MNRRILSLAVPSIVTNITTPLLGLMDVGIVGHMGSAAYIAAIAVGGTLFNMIYWLFGFLRMGSSGMTAQAFGAQDNREISVIFYRAMLVAIGAGIVLIIIHYPLAHIALKFMDTDKETATFALRYFSILIFGAPAVLGSYALSGWFLGMQNARAPMWMSMVVNVSNIAISLFLVVVMKLKISGVACGSLIAQWLGFFIGIVLVTRNYHVIWPGMKSLAEKSGLKRFFAVNTDIFLRTLCLVAVTMWFTRVGASQGTMILAVNTLLLQFFMLFSYFMDGFAFAGEALTGKYVGAGDEKMTRNCIKALFRWGIVLSILFTALYVIFGTGLLNLLSSNRPVVDAAGDYFYWVIAIPLLGFSAFSWDGIFIGATDTRAMLLSMAVATAIYFITYAILFPLLGNHGLWISFLLYLAVRGAVLFILSPRIYRHDRFSDK